MATPRFQLEDFLRPDGSFDNDAWQTSPVHEYANREDAKRIMAERGFTKKKGKSGYSRPPQKPVERFALQPGAKMASGVRGLGGDEVEPVPEDAATAALEELSGKAVKPRLLGAFDPDSEENRLPPPVEPRLLGVFDADAPENKLPPRKGSFWDPAYQALPPDPRAITRRSEPQASTPIPSREAPSTIKFADLKKPDQGAPEDFGSPFPDRQGQETTTDPLGLREQYRKQQLERARRDAGFAVTQMNGDAAIHGPAPEKLAKARADAAGAVGAMKADETEHVQDADFARVEKKVSDMSKPKAALQKFQASRAPSGPLGGPGPSDSGAERPQFDKNPVEMLAELEGKTPGPASARNPLQAAGQLAQGAAPDTSKDEAEMDAASKARDQELLLAQIATNFGHYSDVLSETKGPDRGAGIRANAQRALDLLKEKRGLRKSAADAQTELADKQYEREGIDQQRGALGAKTQREAEFNDATSAKSKQARQIATSLYPKLVARIPPADWQGMSAADVQTFLGEAAPEKQAGGGKFGGGGIKPGEMNSLRKQLPPQLVDTYDQLQNAYAEIEGMGGWTKVKSGLLGSMTPTMFMDPENQKVRQTIGRVVSAFLQSGGGKAITNAEEKILIGKIGADPTSFSVTPEMLERGVGIVERQMANAARQATAGAPQGAKDALFGDMGIDQSWVQGGALPKKPAPMKPMGAKRKLRNPKTGQEIEIDD